MIVSLKSMSNVLKIVYVLLFICLTKHCESKPWLEQADDDPFNHDIDNGRPFYIECVTSLECLKESCCAIGRQRFSLPHCRLHGGLGDSCFPNPVAMKRNHTYPDGVTVKLSHVYDLMCPCAHGLYCDPSTHTCAIDDFMQKVINFVDKDQLYHYQDND